MVEVSFYTKCRSRNSFLWLIYHLKWPIFVKSKIAAFSAMFNFSYFHMLQSAYPPGIDIIEVLFPDKSFIIYGMLQIGFRCLFILNLGLEIHSYGHLIILTDPWSNSLIFTSWEPSFIKHWGVVCMPVLTRNTFWIVYVMLRSHIV